MKKLTVWFALVLGFGSFVQVRASESEPMTVRISRLRNFSEADRAKLDSALTILKNVLNSAAFRERVVHHVYAGQEQFHWNQGLTNIQIFDRIQAGKESYALDNDHAVDLSLTLYKKFWRPWSVVGYTYPNSSEIFLNRNYFNSFRPHQIAANLAHEWCHKLGFDHSSDRNSARPFTVPYAVGAIVEQLGSGRAVP